MRVRLTALAVALALSGCTAGQATPTPQPPATAPDASRAPASPTAAAPSTVMTNSSATATPSESTPAATTASPTPTETTPPPDERTGRRLATPYDVDGIPVVSRQHRISASYRPQDSAGPYGLERMANNALRKMTAAAARDGVRIVVRSGYRSYSEQAAIYARQLRTYPSKELARRYNAPPAPPEHQTGLSVDLFDGVTWGLGMADTATGTWLARHAREYGFILRYPPGTKKERITGYAYEPWHFRWIGTSDSLQFRPNSRKTLEEYLGLA